jgi:hypothetical protein
MTTIRMSINQLEQAAAEWGDCVALIGSNNTPEHRWFDSHEFFLFLVGPQGGIQCKSATTAVHLGLRSFRPTRDIRKSSTK